MDLFLIRHAIAAERDAAAWPDDAERPLTPEGRDRFSRAARGLSVIVPAVEVLLSSPYARAWETAKILAGEAGWPAPVRCDALAADRNPTEVVGLLAGGRAAERVALVGHEPNLSALAAFLLLGDAARPMLEMKKGGVACLRLEGKIRPAAARLRWVLPPKVLRRLA